MFRRLLRRLLPSEPRFRDEFIARIRVAVAGEGMMTEGNIFAFDHAIRHLPPTGAVLEIGSFGGMSTNIIAHLLRKHGHAARPFFTCDPWVYEGFHDTTRRDDARYMALVDGSEQMQRIDYMEFVRESFLRSTRFFSSENLPHSLRLTSDAFFEKWETGGPATDIFGNVAQLGGPLAFAYVDGDHAYDFARRDLENALRWLVPGGFLLLDDSADGLHYGSARLAKELLRDARVALVSRKPNYLFRKSG